MDAPTTRPKVHLGNFDVEQQWSRGEPGLPAPTTLAATATVAAGSELALLLGEPGDLVVLKHAPEPEVVERLRAAGLGGGEALVVEKAEPGRPVTLDALDSPGLLARLGAVAEEGAGLAPHGYSRDEERLCRATGLTPPVADPAVAKRVNGKVYSRRICEREGIARPPGWEVETVDELLAIADRVRDRIAAGTPVGFKSSYGVSGKGIMVCESPARFDRLVRMLARRAERSGDGRMEAVIEEWQDKRTDLNYHFTIGEDGTVAFDFVLEALTRNGTHRGHLLPDRTDPELRERLTECAAALGPRLASEGYRGPVGVDAMVCGDGTLFPVVEINARNNMSTYLQRVGRRLTEAGTAGVAVQIDLSLPEPVPYHRLRAAIGDLALDPEWRQGFLVTCFASVNAAAALANGGRSRGRLHGVAVGPGSAEAAETERRIRERIQEMEAALV